MTQTAAQPQREDLLERRVPGGLEPIEDPRLVREQVVAKLRLIWSERRLLVRVALAALIVFTLVAFLIPTRYDSMAQLMPPDSPSSSNLALLAGLSGSVGGPGGLGMLAGDVLGVKSTGAQFVGVLRSRTVEDRIIDRFNLKRVYGTRMQVNARERLAERTGISEDRKSGIITISVTDHDPKRAADMAGAYIEELNTLIAQLSTSSARRERIFLETRLETVKLDLEAAEKDFSQFASKKGAIDIGEQGKAMVQAAATLEGQLIAAQSELEGLKQIYTANNVRVRSTQARIDELREQLRRLGGKSAVSSEDLGDSSSDALYPTLRQLPILGVPFADKLRRLKIEEAVFEILTKQNEVAKVQEAKEIPSVKVLDAPFVPERKSFPPRLLIMSMGVFFAVLLGAMWLLARASWHETDPQDPAKALAQEILQTFTARMPWFSGNGVSSEPIGTQAKEEGNGQSSNSASA